MHTARPLSKDSEDNQAKTSRRPSWLALVAIIMAIIAIILALSLRSCSTTTSPTSRPTAAVVTTELGAYELWLYLGNTGTEQDFLDSLVGLPGAEGFIGSDGITGAEGIPGSNGVEGKSAYQLWLDAGNTGSPQTFLNSLFGQTGSAGVAGLSAYQLWLSLGNQGTSQQFLDSLAGIAGSTGASGTPGQDGLTAYEIWLDQGHSGTPDFFLASLVGLNGASGLAGATGQTGPEGPPGSIGLTGATGTTGATGATGPVGPSGPAGATGQNGIALEAGSHIKMLSAGHFNLAFSAQMHQTNSSGIVNFWLAKNGVAMPFTNTKLNITANSPYMVAAWNFMINASANDYYELMWSSTSNNTEVLTEPGAGSGATEHPSIPSVIVTVNQVG